MSAIGWAWLVAAAAVLMITAGWWASAETALARASVAGPGNLSGGRRAKRLQTVLADLPRYLNAALLLRVASGTMATVLVTMALVHWWGADWRAFLLASAVMIVPGCVVATMSRRVAGRGSTERMALAAAVVLYPVARVLGPVPRLLTGLGNAVTPGKGARDGAPTSKSELRGLVDFLERRSVIEPGEREMVRSVFELGDTIVREVMVPRTEMVFIERDKTLGQALSLALRSGFSRIPVVGENEDDVVGIAYLKDIVAWSHGHPAAEASEKVATVIRPASYVPDSKPVDELLRQMQAQRSHVAVVIDEYGGTAGLVTIEDILEEIVGEIADEYDENERPPVEWLSDDSARVTARLSVTELGELFGVALEDEDVETVAGLLAHALGRVPIAGSTATVRGLRLTAEHLAGRRNKIDTVLVERAGEAAP